MSYTVGRGPIQLGTRVSSDGMESSAQRLSLRAALRAEGVRTMIADVVTTECGVAPQRARPGSTAWKAYRSGIALLSESRDAWRRVAQPGEPTPDLRAFAFVAANRACWSVLKGNEIKRARLRSQLRCIFALSPGYSLWRTSPIVARRRSEWLVGRAEWQDRARATLRGPGIPGGAGVAARLGLTPTFDTVRAAAMELVDWAGAPVTVESLVNVLGPRPSIEEMLEDHMRPAQPKRPRRAEQVERPMRVVVCPRPPRRLRQRHRIVERVDGRV